jgi:hypothetical protein
LRAARAWSWRRRTSRFSDWQVNRDLLLFRQRLTVAYVDLLPLLFSVTPAFAEQGFDPKYERDYNIFNPINQYRPDNPLNPINSVDPKNPFNPINSVDPGNPANPINRINPNNPFNPINEVNPNNPLNPINRYNPNTPFEPLNRSYRPDR